MNLSLLQKLEGHSERCWSVAWSPDGNLLSSCGGDKSIRIWSKDARTGSWHCSAILEVGKKKLKCALAFAFFFLLNSETGSFIFCL